MAFSYIGYSPAPGTGVHANKVPWLPQTASDIRYYEKPGFGRVLVADFAIFEVDLIRFANQKQWELKAANDYFVSDPLVSLLEPKAPQSEAMEPPSRVGSRALVRVGETLDNTSLIYDRVEKRALFSWHQR